MYSGWHNLGLLKTFLSCVKTKYASEVMRKAFKHLLVLFEVLLW